MKEDTHFQTAEKLPPPPPPKRPTAVGYEEDPFQPSLTPREREILRLAVTGLDDKQISQHLQTSLRNTKKYILRLQTKIDRTSKDSPLNRLLKNRR